MQKMCDFISFIVGRPFESVSVFPSTMILRHMIGKKMNFYFVSVFEITILKSMPLV